MRNLPEKRKKRQYFSNALEIILVNNKNEVALYIFKLPYSMAY